MKYFYIQLNVYGVIFWADENVVKIDSGDGYANCKCTKCH